jgi:hypothetical protein
MLRSAPSADDNTRHPAPRILLKDHSDLMNRARFLPSILLAMTVLVASPSWAETPSPTDIDSQETFRILASAAPTLDLDVLESALLAAGCARQNSIADRQILSVIDYSRPSTERRLWVFDLEERTLLFHELVAHGVNTGENMATQFSNIEGSRQSSLGLFLTGQTYVGRNGYSLKLQGLELNINHLALERTIVMHGAWYVSEAFRREHGRLGRSWGCPAVTEDVARPLIDTIKDGSLLFIYYPDDRWLANSYYLNACEQGRGDLEVRNEPAP